MIEWTLIEHRLALGVIPTDAVTEDRLIRAIVVARELDGGRELAPLLAHASGRYILLDPGRLGERVVLRLVDHDRRWIPRRLAIPLPAADDTSVIRRAREPVLFPGVCWHLGGGATALRGWVLRGAQRVRWAWIEAREPGEQRVATRTRADDRGEFLLVIRHDTIGPMISLPASLDIELRAYGPSNASRPVAASGDPLWDLPIEQLTEPGAPDPVAVADRPQLPLDWQVLGDLRVTLVPGRTATAELAF